MSTPAKRRLLRDFKKIQQEAPEGLTAAPDENDIMKWKAVIFGPEDTIWEGGIFNLRIEFANDYPNKPPAVQFTSKIFHPNVYADGKICLDILQNNWSPIYDVLSILTSIQSLLTDPNPNSPANMEAARLYSENRKLYEKRVQEIVEQTWSEDTTGQDGVPSGTNFDITSVDIDVSDVNELHDDEDDE